MLIPCWLSIIVTSFTLIEKKINSKVKTRYGGSLWGVTLYYFFIGVHVWVYPISKFWKNFTIFLHIMLKYNLGKILENKWFHFIL